MCVPWLTCADLGKFEDLLKRYIAQTVVLYVYNVSTDSVRPVAVIPHASWPGGITKKEGAYWQLLGCGVAAGPRHGLPDSCRATKGRCAGEWLCGRVYCGRIGTVRWSRRRSCGGTTWCATRSGCIV